MRFNLGGLGRILKTAAATDGIGPMLPGTIVTGKVAVGLLTLPPRMRLPPGERYIIRSEMPLRRIGEKPRVSGTRSKEDITQFLGARGWLLERDTAESSVDFAFAGHCVECRTPGHQCRVGGFTGGGGFSL